MDFNVMSLLVALLFICSICGSTRSYAKISISKEEDLEFERQLKILNKPPIKIIHTNEGDIIDCIDMYKQPAFDHPLLKNHKLQLRPSSFPAGLKKISSKRNYLNIISRREACPSGTVPIKRTLKEDLIRTNYLFEQPSRSTIPAEEITPGSHIVNVKMRDNLGFRFYGATAYISVYNVSVAPDQASSANIWIESGPPEDINVISTGWKVSPQLNGDNRTRLFTYWTGDGAHKTGCYGTLCPGFIQTHKEATPNSPMNPISTPGGKIYDIKFLVYQDRQTGNWWLVVADANVVIGYFPKELFSRLGDGAEHVSWGGESNEGKNGISPPMGMGNKPRLNGRYEDSCFFRQVHFVNDRNVTVVPHRYATTEYVDKSGCFGLRNDKYWGDGVMGYSFKFGGPGGNCGVL